MEDTKKSTFNLEKVRRKLFIKTLFKLALSALSLELVNLFAVIFFSRAKKRTKMLIFVNNLLNKKICKHQKLSRKIILLDKKFNINNL